MYAHTTTMRANPQNVDDGIAHIRDEVMPFVQGIEGFVGLSMLCDRDSGRCILTTARETEEAMHASAERVKDSRARAGEVLGDSGPDVGHWEIALRHRRRESPEGACTRVTWLRCDPAGMDEAIGIYRDRVVPAMEQWYGFCSVSALVDRSEGLGAVVMTYESREAMEQSRAQAMALRDQIAAETAVDVLEIAEFEHGVAHLRVPETV